VTPVVSSGSAPASPALKSARLDPPHVDPKLTRSFLAPAHPRNCRRFSTKRLLRNIGEYHRKPNRRFALPIAAWAGSSLKDQGFLLRYRGLYIKMVCAGARGGLVMPMAASRRCCEYGPMSVLSTHDWRRNHGSVGEVARENTGRWPHGSGNASGPCPAWPDSRDFCMDYAACPAYPTATMARETLRGLRCCRGPIQRPGITASNS